MVPLCGFVLVLEFVPVVLGVVEFMVPVEFIVPAPAAELEVA